MKILVFGKTGQVGEEVSQIKKPGLNITQLNRSQADLLKPELIRKTILIEEPDVVLNLAAYTEVDKAEEEKEEANLINSLAPIEMAKASEEINIPFLHLSTDYVFDGGGEEPWKTNEPTKPINAYGKSKLLGEEGIKSACTRYVILRTSWVFSPYRNNFVKSMISLSRKNNYLRVVNDQIGGPTAASDIADVCVQISEALRTDKNLKGTYHFSGIPFVSKADFAREIFKISKRDIIVEDILTEQFPTLALRPKNSRLNSELTVSRFGISLPDWRVSLKHVIDELKESR